MLIVGAFAFALAGCEGDDGAPGATGPAGADGADGLDGQDFVFTPLESCGVCHDVGSVVDAEAVHVKPVVADFADTGYVAYGSFADFVVAPDVGVPADLIVSFSAAAEGVLTAEALFGRAYVSTDGVVRTSLTGEVELDPSLFTNNSDGTYSLRIVDGVARFGGTNSRYLVVVEVGPNELEIAAFGDYPAPISLAGLASDDACIGCHGANGEVGRFAPTTRGGHYSAQISAQPCIVCHRPDDPSTPIPPDDPNGEEPSYMQFFRVVHGIHNSHNFPNGEFVADNGRVYDVTYPTYMANCSVCHKDDVILPGPGVSALAAANAMPVTARGCFSCHGSMENPDWQFPPPLDFHLNFADPLTTDCQTCHAPPPAGFAPATVAEFHNYAGEDVDGNDIGIVTGRGGEIVDGVDTSVSEGAKFVWEITGVADDGVNLAITWQASYEGNSVDPCNTTIGPGAPTFHASGDGNLSMLRNYAQGDDFILGESTTAPGQATSENVTVDNTVCAGLVATTTIAVDDVDYERGIVALQGKPRTVSLGDPTGTQRVRVKTPTYEWLVGTSDVPLANRRAIVDTTGKCLNCHVGSLYQHGGNRVDNVDMCILCHNSASNEKNVRTGMGVDASEAYDGRAGETFEMKTMLHRIHSVAVRDESPFVIYRNRGIYAFASDVSLVPNWDAGGVEGCDEEEIARGERDVFGSDPTSENSCQPHNFHAPDYPRALNACAACHTPNFDVIPDQTEAMASTLDAGSITWEDQLDDTLQGAATTACVTCHADGASKGHAYQNSWTPQEFPEGRQTIIDAVN
jgi:OmcA/MtrC family decaheme c-type cytochrome